MQIFPRQIICIKETDLRATLTDSLKEARDYKLRESEVFVYVMCRDDMKEIKLPVKIKGWSILNQPINSVVDSLVEKIKTSRTWYKFEIK